MGAMESQHVCLDVPTAEDLWRRISGSLGLQEPLVQTLLRQCIFWVVVFLAFHVFQLFSEGRQRRARFRKLSEDFQSQSDSERKGVEQLRLRFQSSASSHGGAALETTPPLVPVSMCVVDDSCGDILAYDRRRLLDAATQLHAPGEEVTVFQACAGPVVQTKLTKLEPASLESIITSSFVTSGKKVAAAAEKGKSILVQLGRWRVFRISITGDKELRLLELDDTNLVPVILHSSYSRGLLNVEGLHLKGATIHATTKNKCTILETKLCNGFIKSSIDGKESCQVEAFTFECGLPSSNLSEVFVLASKKIEVNGLKLSINSPAIQIQNECMRTVIQSIFPLTILVISATTQTLSTILTIMKTTNVASITLWFVIFVVIIATQALSLRIDITISRMLSKVLVSTYYTIYFATQCLSLGEDSRILSVHEDISIVDDQQFLKNGESSSFQFTNDKSIEDPTWEWQVYDKIFDKQTRDYKLVQREPNKVDENNRNQPFTIIYKNTIDLPWASQVEVHIYSSILMEIINTIMPKKIDQIARGQKKVILNGPELFQIQDKLRNEYISSEDKKDLEASSNEGTLNNKEKFFHLQHLLRFMKQEFHEIEPIYLAMNSDNHNASWEMLWSFFPQGERVVYIDNTTQEKLCGDVFLTKYVKNRDEELFFIIIVTKWDYNCRTWKQYYKILEIRKFEREREICNMDVYPLKFVDDSTTISNRFLYQGSVFCELSMKERCCFRNYKGSIFIYKRVKKCLQLFQENADGRVMIDLGSFARMNPDYPGLGSAKPPCDFMRNNDITTYDITYSEDRMFAPAMVYGFSFRLKKWGSFSVCGFSPINYNRLAFDDLLMDEDTKYVMETIVKKQLDDGKDKNFLGRERLDSIAGKGEGTIILCYGPPGTGKTLAAESLSEALECPLWCLSVCELGTTPKILEETLLKVFDVAAFWGAMLLLDEADIFLEKRTTSDLTRNAMTGVFLRLLEYYKGVLFLTTNRDSAFDDAVLSRIAMKLHFERHNEDQQKTMWIKMFERVGLQDVSTKDLIEFAQFDLNGREIRNIVQTAHLLSRNENDKANLKIKHVKKALKVYKKSYVD